MAYLVSKERKIAGLLLVGLLNISDKEQEQDLSTF